MHAIHSTVGSPIAQPGLSKAPHTPQVRGAVRRRMLAIAMIAWVFVAAPVRAPAVEAPRHHSLAEYAYLIGTWKCVANSPGRKPMTYATTMRWMYPEHTAID